MQQMLGVGTAPDGLGNQVGSMVTHPAGPVSAQAPVPQSPITRYFDTGGRPVGDATLLEPEDTSSMAAVQSAGVTALLASVGVGVGLAVGGGYGAGAGLMLVGAAANGLRAVKWMNSADPSQRHEAVTGATFGLFQAAIGSYLAYKASRTRKAS